MRRRRLIVSLPAESYRALEALAVIEERPAESQATYLLKLALAASNEFELTSTLCADSDTACREPAV